ncbi:MAG: hypothetical protein LBJ47_02655 [Tannerella sp.]|nr:hypothetical protein [Tannerella sp.]
MRNYIFMFSSVLAFAGATLYITHWMHAPQVFAVGAAGITVSFMTAPYKNLGFRSRRLHRINILAGVSMIAASVFMFRGRMEWVVFLFISALLLIYTSFVSPRAGE